MKKYNLKVAVCDDEKAALKIVSSSVAGAFESKNIGVDISEFTDVRALYASLKRESYDLIFLDIEMPKADGVEFAARIISEKLARCDEIVFVTGMEERVFDTFRVHPFGFIRKNKFLGDLATLTEQYILARERSKEKLPPLIVSALGRTYSIDIGNIKYIECVQRNQKIFFNDAREPLVVSSTMIELESSVVGAGFCRVHKGYIVNLRRVSLISADGVIMDDRTCIPINRKKLSQFRQEFIEFQSQRGARLLGGAGD